MKNIYIILIMLVASIWDGNAQHYQKTTFGIKTTVDSVDIELQFYSSEIVRIVKTPKNKQCIKESLSVIKLPQICNIKIKQKEDKIQLKSMSLIVILDLKNGEVYFETLKGETLLKEKKTETSFVDFNDAGTTSYSIKQSFVLDKEEPIYGLGILQNGKMSQRNQQVNMVQGNTWDFVPFFQSIKGYGLFWDNYSPTNFVDNEQETSFESEVGDGVDYYFMYGENADGVVAEMRDLTGNVPMLPLWTYGYWQSKERYKSQKELLDVVSKYRELQVPLDGIIQDWQYWGNNYLWNAMEFLNSEFSNPKEMIDKVHNMNAHMIISIWSSFGPQTKQYKELEKIGALFNFKTWPESGLEAWPPNQDYPSGVRVYDAYNPNARTIYWKYLNDGIFKLGMDGWWMDSTEPDHLQFKEEDFDTKTYLGSFRKVRNAYPLMTVGGVAQHQREICSDKRVFILTRSAFAGQQRFGANTWSGDLGSSWESLRNQIPAGLNFTLTGNPNFNTDIGGFFAGQYNKSWNDGTGSSNPLYQELYVRWLQFGIFNPMMRSHGTEVPREIYQFGKKGEPIYDAVEKSIRLRYSLLPYIYSLSWKVTSQQASFMRALFMDFPDDKKVWDMNNEFMFGESFLVAPIVQAQYTPEIVVDEESGWNKQASKDSNGNLIVDFSVNKTSNVYLPKGCSWFDFSTNKKYTGGQNITMNTSIDNILLFVRSGSIVPIGPDVQYATEKKWDNLQIRVYPGADGIFELYEDENDNYNYEKGEYSTIKFNWDDDKKILTINKREGDFSGMLTNRTFSVIVANKSITKEVKYSGKKIDVKL